MNSEHRRELKENTLNFMQKILSSETEERSVFHQCNKLNLGSFNCIESATYMLEKAIFFPVFFPKSNFILVSRRLVMVSVP
jgi:hypothetical protein